MTSTQNIHRGLNAWSQLTFWRLWRGAKDSPSCQHLVGKPDQVTFYSTSSPGKRLCTACSYDVESRTSRSPCDCCGHRRVLERYEYDMSGTQMRLHARICTECRHNPIDRALEQERERELEREREQKQRESAHLVAHLAEMERQKAEKQEQLREIYRRQTESDMARNRELYAGWYEMLGRETPERAFNRHIDAILDEVHALARIGTWPHGTTEAERLGDVIDAIYGLLTDPPADGAA